MNNRKNTILGGILGDIVGSAFEHTGPKPHDFPLISSGCRYTDDSVMTVAIADWLLHGGDLAEVLQRWGRAYPFAGYGGMFRQWLKAKTPKPYGSYGNGSAMRVGPVGFFAKSIEEAHELAARSAEVTHNHPEGIKGAQAVAVAIYMARQGSSKEEILTYVKEHYGYDGFQESYCVREMYGFDATCQGTCPRAFVAFNAGHDYESVVREAVAIGSDSDTLACIAGSIAGAYYGVPQDLCDVAMFHLHNGLRGIVAEFDETIA